MQINGERVKQLRIKNGLSQAELAEGICTQATISLIEKNHKIKNFTMLQKISKKLNTNPDSLLVNQVLDTNFELWDKIESMILNFEHVKANKFLKQNIDIKTLTNFMDQKIYYYFMGETELIGNKNIDEANFYFSIVTSKYRKDIIDIFDVSAFNGISIVYYYKDEPDKCLYYSQTTADLIDSLTISKSNVKSVGRIYYNIAKNFSMSKKYVESIKYANKGITILKDFNEPKALDMLLYEKAFNIFMESSDKELAGSFFFMSYTIATLNNNNKVKSTIKKNLREFNIDLLKYIEKSEESE